MSYNIKNIFKAMSVIACGALVFASCSDTWDDHYKSGIPTTEHSYAGTTMQYLEHNASDFADVIKAAGLGPKLSSSQVFTLLAPMDGTFNKDSLLDLIQNGKAKQVRERFIENHVLLYATSLDNEEKTLSLLNKKKIQFGTLANDSIGSATVAEPNIACNNGIVHLLNGSVRYVPSVFEQIELSHENYLARTGYADEDVVDMYNFLKVYDADSLDERQSVEIGTDSMDNTVYSDSVMIRSNKVLRSLRAYLYREDSTYWAFLPTPEAYKERVDTVKSFFNFNNALNDQEEFRDSVQNYFANYYTMYDFFINRNVNAHYTDSLTTTTYGMSYYGAYNWKDDVYYKPFEGDGVLTKATNQIECSNGRVYEFDEVPNTIYDSFFRKIQVEATNGGIVPETNGKSTDWTITNSFNATYNALNNDTVSNGYLYVKEVQQSRNVQLSFKLPNTLSGTYDVYVKLLPYALMDTTDTVEMRKPVQFRANMYEADAKNVISTKETRFTSPEGGRNFHSNPFRADTIFLGTYTFKYCYRHTGQVGAYLQLQGYLTTKDRANYTRNMLIDFILLKPHREEATEPEQENEVGEE